MKRVTIKDLSSLLNLSTSTISRALSDHQDISEATKIKVKEAAEKFNYTKNFHARFFRGQQSGLIALILPEINMFYTPNLIKGINNSIDKSKYSLITFLTNDSAEKEKEMLKQCMHWSVDGVILSVSKETNNLNHLKALEQSEIPCIQLDKVIESKTHSTVTIDNTDASYRAISHLIKKGHRNIIGIFGNPNFHITQQRIAGYKNALKEHKIPFVKGNIITVDQSDELDRILPTKLRKNKKATALFTMSDELLVKTNFHLSHLGIQVPKDFSIISISDGIYPYLTHPRISHLKDSGEIMGETASTLLINAISESEKLDKKKKSYFISTKLVELDSILDHSNNEPFK